MVAKDMLRFKSTCSLGTEEEEIMGDQINTLLNFELQTEWPKAEEKTRRKAGTALEIQD